MSDDHMVKSFGEELERIDLLIVEMNSLAETQFALPIHALVRLDAKLGNKVRDRDARIDGLEREIKERIVRMLALRQPMASDLRFAIAALKVSNDLERVGDYAKNVAKCFLVLVLSPAMSSTPTISRMATRVQSMIKNVLDAYDARDAAHAEEARFVGQSISCTPVCFANS